MLFSSVTYTSNDSFLWMLTTLSPGVTLIGKPEMILIKEVFVHALYWLDPATDKVAVYSPTAKLIFQYILPLASVLRV